MHHTYIMWFFVFPADLRRYCGNGDAYLSSPVFAVTYVRHTIRNSNKKRFDVITRQICPWFAVTYIIPDLEWASYRTLICLMKARSLSYIRFLIHLSKVLKRDFRNSTNCDFSYRWWLSIPLLIKRSIWRGFRTSKNTVASCCQQPTSCCRALIMYPSACTHYKPYLVAQNGQSAHLFVCLHYH